MSFNKAFKIRTDTSNFQLGEVISQKGKPIAFIVKNLLKTKKGIQ